MTSTKQDFFNLGIRQIKLSRFLSADQRKLGWDRLPGAINIKLTEYKLQDNAFHRRAFEGSFRFEPAVDCVRDIDRSPQLWLNRDVWGRRRPACKEVLLRKPALGRLDTTALVNEKHGGTFLDAKSCYRGKSNAISRHVERRMRLIRT